MQTHTLLFHIGMYKTGTTALQRFLYDNDRMLQKYGWTYPDLCPSEYSAYGNGNGEKLLRRETDSKRWDVIRSALKNYNVIISSEAYWTYLSNLLEAVNTAQTFYDNIKVIVYLRRQDRAVESMYNQLVKGRSEHGSIMEYMNRRLLWTYDYLSILEKISAKIGQENIIVRVYEKGQFEGSRKDIFSDFIYSLPGEPITLKWNEFILPEKENLSLNGNFFEIKKICNFINEDHNQLWWSKKHVRELARVSDMEQNENSFQLSTGYFTKRERISILDSQAKNNAKIAKEYLNRSDGKLFYDDFVDYPIYQSKATEFEEDIILTLCSMLYLQQRKIEMAPAVAAVALLRKNRKLAFWGFGDNGKQLLEYTLLSDIIIDNDPDKYHRTYMGISIIPSDEINNWKEYFIVVTPTSSRIIEDFLLQKGLQKGEDYILLNDFFDYRAIY